MALSTLVLLLAGTLHAQEPRTEQEKVLYAVGLSLAESAAPFGLKREELRHVLQGFADGAAGAKTQVPLSEYAPKVDALKKERANARNQAVLDKAAQEKGALRLGNGLVYQELQLGPGRGPLISDTVKVRYRGTLPDGTVFDESQGSEPASFPLGSVIRCWAEGVQMMRVGGKARLTCPPHLAYGEAGAPPAIPPNSVLVFEVELAGVVK